MDKEGALNQSNMFVGKEGGQPANQQDKQIQLGVLQWLEVGGERERVTKKHRTGNQIS